MVEADLTPVLAVLVEVVPQEVTEAVPVEDMVVLVWV